MSVTIEIMGQQAMLKDGRWRSAEQLLQEMLNAHLGSIQVPGHYPPADKERLAAEAAVRELGAKIIKVRPVTDSDSGLMPDGSLKVY